MHNNSQQKRCMNAYHHVHKAIERKLHNTACVRMFHLYCATGVSKITDIEAQLFKGLLFMKLFNAHVIFIELGQ